MVRSSFDFFGDDAWAVKEAALCSFRLIGRLCATRLAMWWLSALLSCGCAVAGTTPELLLVVAVGGRVFRYRFRNEMHGSSVFAVVTTTDFSALLLVGVSRSPLELLNEELGRLVRERVRLDTPWLLLLWSVRLMSVSNLLTQLWSVDE